MKKYSFFLIVFVVCSFFGCEDDAKKGPSGGSWNRGPIEDVNVTPINGGAEITYAIAEDPDILYIMAEYERNGKIFTEKSSVHKNMLTIEGFHREPSVKAKLYKVNRQEQRSEPIEVEFQPLESLIDIAYRTWHEMASFGGFIASWENPQKTELGVHLMLADEERPGQWASREMFFSTAKNEAHPFRGLDAVETDFAVTIEDKWGNVSDTMKFTLTPFFETMVPKPYVDFRASIPFDNTTNLSGRVMSTLWDNIVNTSGHGWLTLSTAGYGTAITIDMQQVVKLSRIVIHPYHVNSMYGQANITDFEAWGIDNSITFPTNKNYWLDSTNVAQNRLSAAPPGTEIPEHNFKTDWQYLGYHSMTRGLVGQEIIDFCNAGGEYTISLEAVPVRYVRIIVRGIALAVPPALTNYFSCGEITFWGDNTVPQN